MSAEVHYIVFPCGCGRPGQGMFGDHFSVCVAHSRESSRKYPCEDKKDIRYDCGCRYRYEADDGPCAMGHTVLVDSLTVCPTHKRVTLVKNLRQTLEALMAHDRIHPPSQ